MEEIAKTHQDKLTKLKKLVEESEQYFRPNVQRYEDFTKFTFKSSLTSDEEATLASTGKPTVEFNILEAIISRLRGEFAKQQPSLTTRAEDGVPPSQLTREFIETIKVVEAHLRSIFFNGSNDMLEYNVYSDLLAGGFSVLRVYTDYIDELSIEQNIYVERAFDPTLTGFDPLARTSHKGDGRFCYELHPMTEEAFIEEFGEEALKNIQFTRNLGPFSWSFQNEIQKIVLVCDFYEKKRKKETIYKLSNGYTITKSKYDKFLIQWEKEVHIEQPPVVVKQRKTFIETICRYRFCEGSILDYIVTDYKYLPLVFVDGNSITLKEGGSYTQMTRPYIYHAKGIQRLKNYAGQSLANELENTVQHKFIVALESMAEDYLEAYENVQKADVLVYNHFLDTNNPEITLPPPREVMRTPIPPQISDTFRMSDEMTQTILGNYDASSGVNSAKMSGLAFARSAIQSNNASVPYLVGYIKGLNRVAQIVVDLIPKYYQTPRTLPVVSASGKRSSVKINQKGSLYMKFPPNSINVKVETGVNFAMQKEIAMQTLISLCQSNKGFAEFFDEEGLETILDNIEIRGADELKEKAVEWMKKKQQQQQMSSKMQQQQMQMEMAAAQKELQSPSQGQIAAMAIQEQARKDDADITIKSRDSETKFLEVISKIQQADVEAELKAAQVEAENNRSAVDAAVQLGNHINETLERSMNHGKTDNQTT